MSWNGMNRVTSFCVHGGKDWKYLRFLGRTWQTGVVAAECSITQNERADGGSRYELAEWRRVTMMREAALRALLPSYMVGKQHQAGSVGADPVMPMCVPRK
jgi:hypothetical protein